MSVDLSSPHGCQAELQTCSNGLTHLDHLWFLCLNEEGQAEAAWDSVEAKAAAAARDGASHLTAVEVKGRITSWVDADERATKARERLREVRSTKAKLERFFRSIEKRISAAQTAQKGHELLSKAGG